jgi:tRNA (uracil-5-)-methyltransferase TRM9
VGSLLSSSSLARIASARRKARDSGGGSRGRDCFNAVVVADNLVLPHPAARFDFVISVAVIHHLSTRQRRVAAIAEILRALRPPTTAVDVECRDGRAASKSTGDEYMAQALIYVWALEQKSSRRGWTEGDSQDVMVPWVKQGGVGKRWLCIAARDEGLDNAEPRTGTEPETLLRYYHLYRAGELELDIVAAGGIVLDSGYERDNWWATARRGS